MEKTTTSGRDALNELINKAKFHADEALDVGSHVTPTLYIHCHDGTTTGYPLDKILEDEVTLSSNLRLMCVAEGADAIVLCAEAFMLREAPRDKNNLYAPATELSEREEVLVLLVESREVSFQRVLPVIRMDDEQFFRFGEEFDIHKSSLSSQMGSFLGDAIPDKIEQQRAESVLEAQGIFPINGKGRERSLGRAWF